jgi:fructokinase
MRIGIDLGGTKIEGIVLSNDGTVLAKQRINSPRGDYRDILHAIAGVVATLEKQAGRRHNRIGVGTPGAVSPVSGLMRNSNSIELNGQPLKTDLETLLGREIRLVNDANCFALSEATDGAAQGASVVFGVILGTGVGAGVVVNGQVLTGVNAVAGEWGHNSLPWPRKEDLPGFECYCGKKGCIETYLSGPGFARDYASLANNKKLTAEKIVKLAEQGDSTAETALRRYEDRLARALSHVINMLDPDVIVLGGGVSNIQRLYKNVPALWGEYVFSDVVQTQLVPPKYGDSSGVRGAAWLWDGVAGY